jgi:hypothetical protein
MKKYSNKSVNSVYIVFVYRIPFKLTFIRIVNTLHNKVYEIFPPVQDGHESHLIQQDSEFGGISPLPVVNKENP